MSPTSEVEYPISPAPIPFRRGKVSAIARSTADAASHLPEVASIICSAPIAAIGVDLVSSGEVGGRAADLLEHRHALGVDVAAGGDAHPALNAGGRGR